MARRGPGISPRPAALDGGVPVPGHRGAQPDVRAPVHRRLRRAGPGQRRHPPVPGPCQCQVRRRDQLRATHAHRPQPLVAPGGERGAVVEPGGVPLPHRRHRGRQSHAPGLGARHRAHRQPLRRGDAPHGARCLRRRAARPRSPGLLPGLPVRLLPPGSALRLGHRRPHRRRRRLQARRGRVDRLRHPAEPLDGHRVDRLRGGLDAARAGALRLAPARSPGLGRAAAPPDPGALSRARSRPLAGRTWGSSPRARPLPGRRDAQAPSGAPDALGDAVADLLVDVAPVLERSFQDGGGHAVAEMPDDVGDQAVARRVVEDVADQGAGLAPVVVVGGAACRRSGRTRRRPPTAQRRGGAAGRPVGRPWSSARTPGRRPSAPAWPRPCCSCARVPGARSPGSACS